MDFRHIIQRALRRHGIDVRRAIPNVMDFLEDRQIDVVVDVGANVGQFGLSLRNKGYRGKIISFEPLRSEFQRLARIAKADSNWEVYNFGLGGASGVAKINVSGSSVFSSIQTLNSSAIEFDSGAAVSRTETIEIRTLDEFFPKPSSKILLKVDTQGYEKPILEGGRQMLLQVKGILLELPIIRIYKDTWKFHEALEFMDSIGFIPAQIEPVIYHSKDRVSLVEVDGLFRRRDALLD